jgi:hypothetical protein
VLEAEEILMYKQMKITTLHYEMLVETAKSRRVKPEDLLGTLIKNAFNSK